MLKPSDLQRLKQALRAEDGQMIVMTAMMGLFLLAILAIVIESSFVYFQRRDLQNQADSAALAGAQNLDGTAASDAAAIAAANQYAADNLAGATVDPEVDETHTKITVTVSKPAETAFAGWLSFGSPTVHAHAAAQIRSAQLPGPGVFPATIDQTTWQFAQDNPGTLVVLKAVPHNNPGGGDFQLLDFGNGAKTVCAGTEGGSPIPITDPQDAKEGDVSKLKNDDCLPGRLEAAKDWGCYQLSDILDADGKITDHCNPLIGAKKGVDPAYPDAQPTSVALIPIIQTFATFKGSESHQFDLLQGADNERVFSFFYLDPINAEVLTKSVTDTSGNAATITGPTCAKGKGGGGGGKGGGGVGQCENRGPVSPALRRCASAERPTRRGLR